MNPRKAICLLAVLLMACAPLALAQGTYTQIDYPGAFGTYTNGIDAAGDIVGYYVDASNHLHGFLLRGGTYTTIDYPGAISTTLRGINDSGQIVGFTTGCCDANIGFLYDVTTHTFTTISCSAKMTTWPEAINDNGIIAGIAFFASRPDGIGFVWTSSGCRYIVPPGATRSNFVTVYGISAQSKVPVGDFVSSTDNANFVFQHGKYQQLRILKALPFASVRGINGAGTAIVGSYNPSPTYYSGFLLQNGAVQPIFFPGSVDSLAAGINDAGIVVGFFDDVYHYSHGFLWTPPGDAAKK